MGWIALKSHIARTLAALSVTNEAILYAKSPGELYRKVCEAAFSSGDFLAVAVFLLEETTGLLRCVEGFGEDVARLRSIDISSIEGTPEGEGVGGKAFRSQALCVSNDFLHESHSLAWREGVAKAKAEGKYKGRAPTARAKATDIRRLCGEGVGATEIGKRLGISRASVYRVLASI